MDAQESDRSVTRSKKCGGKWLRLTQVLFQTQQLQRSSVFLLWMCTFNVRGQVCVDVAGSLIDGDAG